MRKRKIYGVFIVAVVIVTISLLVYLNKSVLTPADTLTPLPLNKPITAQEINTFEECVAVTNLVFTSTPSKCIAPDGRVFVNPLANQVIKEVEK